MCFAVWLRFENAMLRLRNFMRLRFMVLCIVSCALRFKVAFCVLRFVRFAFRAFCVLRVLRFSVLSFDAF